MRCAKAKKLISEYIDGNLGAEKSVGLEQHLDTCADCQTLLKDFQTITQDAQELKEDSPSPHAWLKIKERLTTEEQKVLALQPQKKRWFHFPQPRLKYALSSALVLVVMVGIVIFGIWYVKGRGILEGLDAQSYTLAKLAEAERHYQLAIEALWEAVSSQEESLDPQVVKVFRTNLEIIDMSIADCRQAVLSQPEDIEARNYLLTAYKKKVDFLNEMMVARETSSRQKAKTTI
ncbi:MAG: zf-HC2 domain-containing protein [Candidatus Aminicenantes bacterium]|nr:MAG: zf-HC2 domain-containing protein [Candidatus Aminicenantes bacterium]